MDQCDTKIDVVKYMWVSDIYLWSIDFVFYLVVHLNYFYILRIGAGQVFFRAPPGICSSEGIILLISP